MKTLYLFLLFTLPLIMVGNTNELFEFPKTFFLYILGTLIIATFLTLYILAPFKLRLPSKFVFLYVGSFIISTLLSSHGYTSIWGYYTRFNGGLISFLLGFGLYFVAITVFDKLDFTEILDYAFYNLIPISIYGLYQHFFENTVRIYATFGQPNWLAQYLAMGILFYVVLYLQHGAFKHLLLAILGFCCLWVTYSISGLVAFVLCILLLGLALYKELPKKQRLVFLLIPMAVFAVFNLGIFEARITSVLLDAKKYFSAITVVTTAYAQSSNVQLSDPGFIRLGLWQGTWQLITSSPKVFFLGSGPETFPYAFQPFRTNELNYSSEWDFVFNKPHNYYLEVWAEKGLLGLISYLILIQQLLVRLPKAYNFGFVAFVITNFFGWPCVATGLLFWLFLAFGEVTKHEVA